MDGMTLQKELKKIVNGAAKKLHIGKLDTEISLERPKSPEHGDYSSNLALQLAKKLDQNPREIANLIKAQISESHIIKKVDVAGPGFLNFYIKNEVKQKVILDILRKCDKFGANKVGNGKKILLEFVSANPTGPLHVGHGRGAAFGASLANILETCGFDVFREYYVNDAGRQIDILTLSVWCRYLALFAKCSAFPEKGYQGKYIEKFAEGLKEEFGDLWVREVDFSYFSEDSEAVLDHFIKQAKTVLGTEYELLKQRAIKEQVKSCKADLHSFGVYFDQWFSEKSLFLKGSVESIIRKLESVGYVESREGAKWFKSTIFGDDKDRVLKKSNGEYTYFASDIAYHHDKFKRGYSRIINIWGADHHGYIPRMRAALKALGHHDSNLEILLIQFVSLFRAAKKISMSTRSGEFVSLNDLVSEVGIDAARYFYSLRKSDQHLDFDLSLAKARNNENPVYYVQYAHARCANILAKWSGSIDEVVRCQNHLPLDQSDELALLQKLGEYSEVIKICVEDFSPHYLTNYLRELAVLLHRYYNSTQVLSAEGLLRQTRISLIAAVKQVLKNGLSLLNVSAPNKM